MNVMPHPLNIKMSLLHRLVIIAAILTGMVFPAAAGLGLEGTEDQIKGAMMVNFIQFIKWPDQVMDRTGGVITIGVFGNDHFGHALDPIEGRTVGAYRLSIRRISQLDQLAECQVLFICSSHAHLSSDIFRKVYGLPILTIGEDEDFLHSGGIIRFYMDKNHVRFAINKTAAFDADLKISAKLIEIASTFE
ncbi:MAG: YfiR family protein [Desulfobacteraceae bacterium]|nr:YfiR family protein [Desulfobacteraceae bacterium]